MAQSSLARCRIAGISTCVPSGVFDNLTDTEGFSRDEVRKVVAMAGVKQRFVSDGSICASDLCLKAARDLLAELDWAPDTVDGLILVTQSPDYFLPSTSCLLHRDLALAPDCATFDVGLGCSGYPYGLWMAWMMINSGMRRVLVLHGETPSAFTDPQDRATFLLFGDAGSATALERDEDAAPVYFSLHTDGRGYDDLIINSGGFRDRFPEDQRQYYLRMNGTDLFNFTLQRVPPLIETTLAMAQKSVGDIDYYIFHQSNQFMMKHLAKKCGLPEDRTPIILERFGNTGGPSVPLTITRGVEQRPADRPLCMMLLGYGVGLSWSSALVDVNPDIPFTHSQLEQRCLGV